MLQATGSMALPKAFFVLGGLLIVIIFAFHELGPRSDSVTTRMRALQASLSGNSFQKRLEKYEQIWQQSVDARHTMYAAFKDPLKNMFPAINDESYKRTPFTVWDFFPSTFTCPHEMERLGRLGHGGKWLCGMSRYETTSVRRPCVVYSLGIQADSSFEEQILRRTECVVFGVDPTAVKFGDELRNLAPEQKARAHLQQYHVSAKTNNITAEPAEYSLQDLMAVNGHEYIDALKLDLAGSEFEVLASLLDAHKGTPLPVGQLQIKISVHQKGHEEIDFPYFLKWWERLEKAGMRPVWMEADLVSTTIGEGRTFPAVVDYTFVNVRHPRNVLLSG